MHVLSSSLGGGGAGITSAGPGRTFLVEDSNATSSPLANFCASASTFRDMSLGASFSQLRGKASTLVVSAAV